MCRLSPVTHLALVSRTFATAVRAESARIPVFKRAINFVRWCQASAERRSPVVLRVPEGGESAVSASAYAIGALAAIWPRLGSSLTSLTCPLPATAELDEIVERMLRSAVGLQYLRLEGSEREGPEFVPGVGRILVDMSSAATLVALSIQEAIFHGETVASLPRLRQVALQDVTGADRLIKALALAAPALRLLWIEGVSSWYIMAGSGDGSAHGLLAAVELMVGRLVGLGLAFRVGSGDDEPDQTLEDLRQVRDQVYQEARSLRSLVVEDLMLAPAVAALPKLVELSIGSSPIDSNPLLVAALYHRLGMSPSLRYLAFSASEELREALGVRELS